MGRKGLLYGLQPLLRPRDEFSTARPRKVRSPPQVPNAITKVCVVGGGEGRNDMQSKGPPLILNTG